MSSPIGFYKFCCLFLAAVFILLAGCTPQTVTPISLAEIQAFRRGARLETSTQAEMASMQDALANPHFHCLDAPQVLSSERMAVLSAHQKVGEAADDYLPGGLDSCDLVWLVVLQCDIEIINPKGEALSPLAPDCLYTIMSEDQPAGVEIGAIECPE